MTIINTPAADLNAGLAERRPGFAARLSAWLKNKRTAAPAETPLSALDSATSYDPGYDDTANESKISSLAANNPHVVVAKLFMGIR